MSPGPEDRLTPLQVATATRFFSLPESRGFLLAGGGALIAHGVVARRTDDLDFFTTRGGGDVAAAAEALLGAATRLGWTADVVRSGPEFRRITVVRRLDPGPPGPEVVQVDLAVDTPPSGAPTVTVAGPSLALPDLAVRKTLALYGRAEPRDFTDVHAINQHVDRAEVLEAAAADPGFDRGIFARMLRAHRRLRDDDFPTSDVTEVRAYADAWADELER